MPKTPATLFPVDKPKRTRRAWAIVEKPIQFERELLEWVEAEGLKARRNLSQEINFRLARAKRQQEQALAREEGKKKAKLEAV